MLPLAPKLPNITCICFAKIPIPMAASIPCMADEGKKLLRDPNRRIPRINIRIPENTIAANVNK